MIDDFTRVTMGAAEAERRAVASTFVKQFESGLLTVADLSDKLNEVVGPRILTEDGKSVHVGSFVFNYYEREWGTIATPPDNEGWFDFVNKLGQRRLLNGERISTYDPNA